jgi:hypothetical protein
MANVAGPGAVLEMAEAVAAARTLGIETVTFEIRKAGDIALAFDSFKGHTEALYISTDPLVFTNRIRINTLAQGMRLPTMYMSKRAGSYPMEQTSLIFFGVPPIMSTRFCGERSLPICR